MQSICITISGLQSFHPNIFRANIAKMKYKYLVRVKSMSETVLDVKGAEIRLVLSFITIFFSKKQNRSHISKILYNILVKIEHFSLFGKSLIFVSLMSKPNQNKIPQPCKYLVFTTPILLLVLPCDACLLFS